MSAVATAILLAPLPFALIWAAASDARRFIIPNRASVLCALGAAPALAFSGLGFDAIALHAAVGVGALALGFTLFALGLWGGGDGKLLAAAALWFDPTAAASLLVYICLAGGALGALALAARYYAARLAPALGLPAPAFGRWATHAPFGIAIAIGALSAFPETALFAVYAG